jgi:hypothetical protein
VLRVAMEADLVGKIIYQLYRANPILFKWAGVVDLAGLLEVIVIL